jgi:hypothetical protein
VLIIDGFAGYLKCYPIFLRRWVAFPPHCLFGVQKPDFKLKFASAPGSPFKHTILYGGFIVGMKEVHDRMADKVFRDKTIFSNRIADESNPSPGSSRYRISGDLSIID